MADTLPSYVIIQSNDNHRYARLDREYQSLRNALRFEGEYSFGLETRFELVPATTTGFVHIRCLQNNRYWEKSGDWVTATAVKPQEDISDQHCTLFQPVFLKLNENNHHVVKLRQANTGKFVRMHIDNNDDYNGCLTLRPKLQPDDDDNTDVCTFIDWESVVVLPDVIRIKDYNGNHLKAYTKAFKNLMKFQSKADDSSMYDYDVFPIRDGGIRLKSTHFGTYWTHIDHSWKHMDPVHHVSLEQDDPKRATNTTFLPVKVDGNRILLRNLVSGKFCRRHDGFPHKSSLSAINKYPDEFCHMEIEEPVIARAISNVRYQLTSARIYYERILALITDDSRNRTKNPHTSQINLKTMVTNTKNWSTSVSFKKEVKMTGTLGVPRVNGGCLEISCESKQSREWGETEMESIEVGSVRTVTVPPSSRVKASLMATRCSYDIPFSYTQRDVLMNGNTRVSTKNDGLCKGEDGYNYNYEIVELPL